MAEWLKAADCKSVEFLIVGSNPTLSLTKCSVVGSAPVLGTGGHVFKSHYFEFLFIVNLLLVFKHFSKLL
jgi:hypothetical protein